jgi:hypothetical protein
VQLLGEPDHRRRSVAAPIALARESQHRVRCDAVMLHETLSDSVSACVCVFICADLCVEWRCAACGRGQLCSHWRPSLPVPVNTGTVISNRFQLGCLINSLRGHPSNSVLNRFEPNSVSNTAADLQHSSRCRYLPRTPYTGQNGSSATLDVALTVTQCGLDVVHTRCAQAAQQYRVLYR